MKQNEFPEGWNQERVQDLLEYYESQTEDEAVAEYEAACSSSSEPMIGVPLELLRATVPVEGLACPKCNRTISPRLPKCMYCGQPIVHDPFA